MIVDSLNHPLASELRSILALEVPDKILIDDEENILMALKSGVTIEHIFSTDLKLSTNLPQDLVRSLSLRTGKKIFGNEKVSRVVAIAKRPNVPTLENFKNIQSDFIILEDLTISGNLGAITRTAHAFDSGVLVFLDKNADVFDRRIIRASRGTIFAHPKCLATLQELVQFCREKSLPLLVTSPTAKVSIDDVLSQKGNFAIAFGSEKTGHSKEIEDAANLSCTIPMKNSAVESLNVSAAASIIFYLRDLSRRRPLST